MKYSWLVLVLATTFLVGCGEQQGYEKQPFPELPEAGDVQSNSQEDGNFIPVVRSEQEPSRDGIERPPRGPIGTLKDSHPELFE